MADVQLHPSQNVDSLPTAGASGTLRSPFRTVIRVGVPSARIRFDWAIRQRSSDRVHRCHDGLLDRRHLLAFRSWLRHSWERRRREPGVSLGDPTHVDHGLLHPGHSATAVPRHLLKAEGVLQ